MTKTLKSEADRITKILVKKYRPEKIILFGSVARGEEKENSDLDFFIVKDTKKTFSTGLVRQEKLLNPIGISTSSYTARKNLKKPSPNKLFS